MDDIKKNNDIDVIPEDEAISLDGAAKKLKARLKHCEEEKKKNLDGWQRAQADMVNHKNDEGKRMEDLARFVNMSFVQDIMPVLDSFDLALAHEMPPDVEKGVTLIQTQFMDVLKKRGVEEIITVPGDAFDPAVHESIGETESKEYAAGCIVQVVQKGYQLKEVVIRPARVKLAV